MRLERCKNPDGSSAVPGWTRENRLLDEHYVLMEGYDVTMAEDKGAHLIAEQTFSSGLFAFDQARSPTTLRCRPVSVQIYSTLIP